MRRDPGTAARQATPAPGRDPVRPCGPHQACDALEHRTPSYHSSASTPSSRHMVLTSWLAFCARMNRWITAGSAAPPGRRRPRLSGFPLVLEHAHPTSELGQLGALLGGQLVALSSIELGLADALAKRLEGHAEIASDHAQLRPRLASQWKGLNLELRVRRSGPPSQRGLLPGAERLQLPGVHRTGSRPGQASDHARERARRTGTQPRWAGRRSPGVSSRRRRTGEPPRAPSTVHAIRNAT